VNLFAVISRYFWLVILGGAVYNYVVSARAIAERNPQDADICAAAISFRRWFAVGSIIPWVVMGVGILFGGVPNIWYYFRPQDRNPYVLAWFASLFIGALWFAYWVFILGGAEKAVALRLIELTGFRGPIKLTANRVRFFALLGPIWIALWVYYAAYLNVNVPK
jgi:hypothetical protein